MPEFDVVLPAVANYGFPMVVAAYLLMRMENVLKKNTEALNVIIAKLDMIEKN